MDTQYENRYLANDKMFSEYVRKVLSIAILPPILAIRQIKESSKRITNGQTYETVVKFGDNISMAEGTFSLTIEYSQVLKIHNLQY